uniref:Uncharacterized protein n=1 Tax=Cannabis sativa TaxID=3483 RepID=A0A803PZ62_CANSA
MVDNGHDSGRYNSSVFEEENNGGNGVKVNDLGKQLISDCVSILESKRQREELIGLGQSSEEAGWIEEVGMGWVGITHVGLVHEEGLLVDEMDHGNVEASKNDLMAGCSCMDAHGHSGELAMLWRNENEIVVQGFCKNNIDVLASSFADLSSVRRPKNGVVALNSYVQSGAEFDTNFWRSFIKGVCLGLVRGHLRLLQLFLDKEAGGHYVLRAWDLVQSYSSPSSPWVMVKDVRLKWGAYENMSLCPIAFHPEDEDVIFFKRVLLNHNDNVEIFRYRFGSKCYEHVCYCPFAEKTLSLRILPVLVHGWPTRIPPLYTKSPQPCFRLSNLDIDSV